MTGSAIPLPPRSVVRPQPGTTLAGMLLEGGTPRRRVALTPQSASVTAALLAGSTVAEAARSAGCTTTVAGEVGRRLLATAMVAPAPSPDPSGDRPTTADVAAVIPAHDAAGTIAAAIAGVEGVAEIVVVDDGSGDDTARVATVAGARVIRNERPTGPAAARNRGISATTADIVVVLDSDTAPERGWLDRLLDHLVDPWVGGAAPRVITIDDGSTLGGYEVSSSPHDLGAWPAVVRPDGPVPFVSTTALVLRREVWAALGGFTETLRFGEDLDFAWRCAEHRPLVYEPAAVVGHRHRPSLGAHLRNRSRYGSAAGPLSRRHPDHPRAAVAPPLLAGAAVAGVTGFPRTATLLAAASVGDTTLRLRAVGEPPGPAVRDAIRSALRSSRGLAAAVSRPWLPVALLLGAVRRRSRLVVAAAVVARLETNRRREPAAGPARNWYLLRFLDDLAFSTGVLRGCFVARDLRPLTARRPPGPARTTTVLGTELTLP